MLGKMLFTREEANPTFSGGGKVLSVAIKVTGYDLESSPKRALGIRLDTNEEVTIALNEERVAKLHKTKSKEPPKIEYFAQGGQSEELKKRRVREGGVILFNGVFETSNGLEAGWAQALHHGTNGYQRDDEYVFGDNDTVSYFYTLANLGVWTDKQTGETKGVVNILLTNTDYSDHISPKMKEKLSLKGKCFGPAIYTSLEKCRQYTELLFERGLGVVMRANMKDNRDGYSVIAVDAMNTFGENLPTAKEWYEKRVQPILGKPELVKAFEEGQCEIEVIPVLRMALNKNFRADLGQTPRMRSLAEKYNTKTVKGSQRLYFLSHVSVYMHPDSDAAVVSAITPQNMQDGYLGMDAAGYYAETANGKGTDDGLIANGQNVAEYKVEYKKAEKAVEKSALEAAAVAADQASAESQPAEEEPTFTDDDIPF